jgi:tight adherence protein B
MRTRFGLGACVRSCFGAPRSEGCATAGLLRNVAGHLRAGTTLRGALEKLHDEAPVPFREPLARLSHRLALGQSVADALAQTRGVFEDQDASALASLISVHERDGGNLAGMLEALADRLDSRAAAIEAARGAGAGAMLSGRIVTGLPLLLLLVAPGADRRLLEPGGLAMVATGVGLVAVGAVWIRRLIPRPERIEDSVAVVCDVAACALTAGAGLHAALGAGLDACARDIRPQLSRAHRMVQIGASWPEALRRSGDADLADVAATIAHAQGLGVPLAGSLARWAESRRSSRLHDFDVAVRRAPVLMVVPLTVCMLPAYLILGLGPVLRGY